MLQEDEDGHDSAVPPEDGVPKIYHGPPYDQWQYARPEEAARCQELPFGYAQNNCETGQSLKPPHLHRQSRMTALDLPGRKYCCYLLLNMIIQGRAALILVMPLAKS